MDTVIAIIEHEYHQFKDWVLNHTAEQIWALSSQITFYLEVYEYFSYAPSSNEVFNVITGRSIPFIQSLWLLHLKSDIYDGSIWDEITFLIRQTIESEQKLIA